jgi:hypothetical protein
MKPQMTFKRLQKVREKLHAIWRGEIKPPSTSSLEVSAEEWEKLVGNEERVYTSFNPLGNNPKKK